MQHGRSREEAIRVASMQCKHSHFVHNAIGLVFEIVPELAKGKRR